MSVRLKLALSYTGVLVVTGALLLAVVWVFLLRYVPDEAIRIPAPGGEARPSLFIPGRYDLWRAFAPKAAIVMGLLLSLGAWGGWVLAGRMLTPLSKITEATRLVAGGSLSHRIALAGHNDEVRELADSFDGMIARIEALVVEQRRFAANASHELRTPLAISKALLDVARDDPDRDVEELLGRLRTVNDRAIELIEALLLLGRVEGRAFAREPVDLSLLAEEAIETLLPVAEDRGVELVTFGDVAPVVGSRPLLAQMTTNLVHNAIVHNLPEGGSVWVRTEVGTETVLLVVENTGVVLDPRVVEGLVEPFQRGVERVRADHGGVGLGLAIVKGIVQAHGGGLTLVPRIVGGLRTEVSLPRGRPPASARGAAPHRARVTSG